MDVTELQPDKADLSHGRPPDEWYVCILPNRLDVEQWREGELSLDSTGPINPKDHRVPLNSYCFGSNLSMVFDLEGLPVPPLDDLWEQLVAAGVYRPKTEKEIGEDGPGWKGAIHDKAIDFINSRGLVAWREVDVTPADMAAHLRRRRYVIPSVSPEIRFLRNTEPASKSGHSVLVYAHEGHSDPAIATFRLQNSAGFATLNSQSGVRITWERTAQVTNGRAIIVQSNR